ncbi:MAG: polyribonucleotide nucleotidyltransferase [Nitrospiria bacterium]
MVQKVEMEIAGKILSLETGRVAKQADGAVLAQYGETVVLITVVAAKEPKPNVDFLPLTVDYQERHYAAGKIPGGFFKREGRPGERETLTSRLIDRPMRPLFPKHYCNETQIIASVLSADLSNSMDFLGIIGASTALMISPIAFHGPVGAVRVGRVDGRLILNPGLAELEKSDINVVVASTRDAVMMVEGEAREVPEQVMLDAILFAHAQSQAILDLQEKLVALVGQSKMEVPVNEPDPQQIQSVRDLVLGPLRQALLVAQKEERKQQLEALKNDLMTRLATPLAASGGSGGKADEKQVRQIEAIFHELEREEMRRIVLEKGIRSDGRGPRDIRPITCEVGVLPRTHGSALFTRGETQSLCVVTLGTSEDEQRIDALEGESTKTFMLHYNFPPFSVGETRPLRGPGRREIGHGQLAERALKPAIPTKEVFPYTLRIVSDILESNGSTSMATVCGGTLALMDAGVPIKAPVAGIAMGLIREGNRVEVLSDILGLEDHLGDMDFKVAGTRDGVTALQMDSKIEGINREILTRALEQAKEGRLHILDKMMEAIPTHRETLSSYAPRIVTMKIKPDKIREVIGPGGKMIRSIIEKTGVKIDVEDSGVISIASVDEAAAKQAMEIILKITEEVEVGKIYIGKVKRIMDFGAFVEILPNTEGLVHISQMAYHRVQSVSDVVSEGDEITVKVIEIDKQGKIRLSRKEALNPERESDREGQRH